MQISAGIEQRTAVMTWLVCPGYVWLKIEDCKYQGKEIKSESYWCNKDDRSLWLQNDETS